MSWSGRKSAFDKSIVVGAGGKWIFNEMNKFSKRIEKSEMDEHSGLMTCAIVGLIRSETFGDEHFDHRFFYRIADRLVLVLPISQYVSKVMSHILIDLKRTEYYAKLIPKWLTDVMDSELSNEVMKGFAYEQFYIAQILLGNVAQRHAILGVEIKVEPVENTFNGDYPTLSALNTAKNTATLFRPRKYNLRYVDCVVRHVDSTGAVTIIAIQITLQTPVDHQNSLEFYSTAHDEMADCRRYEHTSDKERTHKFVWIVPHKAAKVPNKPAECAVSFEQRVKCCPSRP